MRKKKYNQFLFAVMLVFSLLFSHVSYAVVAYMPVELRECLSSIEEVNGRGANNSLQELCAMIRENRVVASDRLVCNGLNEALIILSKNDAFDNKWKEAAKNYLKNYRDNLDRRSILCSLKGDSNALTIIPNALLARTLPEDSKGRDIIYLSSQLADIQNIELCGLASLNAGFPQSMSTVSKNVVPTNANVPSIMFNANMLTNNVSPFPNVVFGTGVSSPVINAWAMPHSSVAQAPVNMQFAIPGELRPQKAASLEIHFVIKREAFANGYARVRINSLYVDNMVPFSIPSDSSEFTDSIYSENFFIAEPTSNDELLHIFIDVPLENSNIQRRNFALISLSRISTTGTEYPGNIYVVATAFKYTV